MGDSRRIYTSFVVSHILVIVHVPHVNLEGK